MAHSQIRRALTLLNLLQTGHDTDVESLAQRLGCSTRTVFRDFKLLNDNNIQVRFDETLGGYTIDTRLAALPAAVGEQELIGLLVAAIVSPLSRQGPAAASISHQGLVRLMQRLSGRTRGRVGRMVAAIVLPPCPVEIDARQSRMFDKLLQAIADRLRVEVFWNQSPADGDRQSLLSAYQLRVQQGEWTVLGWSSAHGEVTELRLADIRSVTATERSYRVPLRFLRRSKAPAEPSSPAGTRTRADASRRHTKQSLPSQHRPAGKGVSSKQSRE